MKCVILAGGSGDSLWPLSRRQFPKQFMKIKEGRSILQETVVRNMPFCEEFIIVTNESYKNIVNGQMKAFQSLKYRVILEGTPKGTGAAVLLGTMFANPSELVLVVNSDNLIEGDGYKDSIIEAKEYAKEGYLAVLGIKPESQSSTYGYILRDKENVKKFIARIDFDEDETEGLLGYDYDEGYLWNSGILVFRAGDMVNAARRLASELYTTCKTAKRKVPAIRRSVRFSETVMQAMPHGSIETLLLEKCDSIKVVEAHFEWMDVGNASDLAEFGNNIKSECVIKNDCDNVNIINNAPKRLVVANDLRDLVVVNTDDATYISSKKSADNIKQIMKDNMDTYEAFFDYNRTTYNETADYNKYESVFIPVGTKHRIANKTDKNVVVIEVGIGDNISDTDLVKIYNKDNPQASANYVRLDKSPIAKLEPAFKDNLWGGTKIRDVYGKKCDYDVIGESWELSAHPDGQSRIAEGRYKGMLFNEYLNIIGKEALGWKCQAQDRFPILIKFIDAKQALSIQIHPDDEYALENENEYGKNEMWYVVDSEPGSYLYCGLSRDASKEEILERINNNTITDILNKIEVKAGDVVMVKAGTIHAIGAGVFICEIQQNSNCTYRMYDYDRRDKFGNPRELHVKKALDVVDNHKYIKDNKTEVVIARNEHFTEERLVQCKYFEVYKYDVNDEAKITVDEASFVSVLFINGSGTIETDDYEKTMEFKAGDSFFVSAGLRSIIIKGQATMVVTRV